MKPKHLLVVDLDGHVLEGTGKASSESALHLEIYRKRDDVKAIIHAHPITATALTVAASPSGQTSSPKEPWSWDRCRPYPMRRRGPEALALACAEAAEGRMSSSWNVTALPPSAKI